MLAHDAVAGIVLAAMLVPVGIAYAVASGVPGIGLAIVIAVIEFLWDGWRPHSGARQVPGLVLFRWDAPLFFANAELFKERVLEAVARAATPVRWMVVAAEPVTSVDVTAADSLVELDKALREAGIELCFAELKDPVKDKLKRFGLFEQIGAEFFFPTVGAAVSRYVETHAVDWVDWEDRGGSSAGGRPG